MAISTQISFFKVKLLLFFTLFVLHQSFAQITVVNQEGNPIDQVELISNNSRFYAISNINGEVEQVKFENLKLVDTLVFKHYFYETRVIPFLDLQPHDTIRLREHVFEYEEIVIAAKKKGPKYKRLEACYRSYQYNDDSLTYYQDGKLDYISKIKKDKYKRYTKQSRSFSNDKIIADIPEHTVGLRYSANVPSPPYLYLPKTFGEDNDIVYRSVDSSKVELFVDDSTFIGYYEHKGEYVRFVFNDINFIRTYNLINSELHRLNREVTLVFRYVEGMKIQEINNFEHLMYYKNVRKMKTKHNKDKAFIHLLQVEELFLEDVNYLYDFDKRNYGAEMRSEYNYSEVFWNFCDCIYYQAPNKYLWKNLVLK